MDGDGAHSMEAEREMTRLWRTFRTVYELLADRVGNLKFSDFSGTIASLRSHRQAFNAKKYFSHRVTKSPIMSWQSR
jgi:hypothetical protein